jgi:hypothetical protein
MMGCVLENARELKIVQKCSVFIQMEATHTDKQVLGLRECLLGSLNPTQGSLHVARMLLPQTPFRAPSSPFLDL